MMVAGGGSVKVQTEYSSWVSARDTQITRPIACGRAKATTARVAHGISLRCAKQKPHRVHQPNPGTIFIYIVQTVNHSHSPRRRCKRGGTLFGVLLFCVYSMRNCSRLTDVDFDVHFTNKLKARDMLRRDQDALHPNRKRQSEVSLAESSFALNHHHFATDGHTFILAHLRTSSLNHHFW